MLRTDVMAFSETKLQKLSGKCITGQRLVHKIFECVAVRVLSWSRVCWISNSCTQSAEDDVFFINNRVLSWISVEDNAFGLRVHCLGKYPPPGPFCCPFFYSEELFLS